MFTISDICNIAVQIECNGEKTYLEASKKTPVPQMALIFEAMAEDERCHAKWFERVKSQQPVHPEQRELEDMGRKLLQEMVEGQTFSLDLDELNRAGECDEVLEQLITFERDTVLFYEFLREIIDEPDAKEQLTLIIEEENKHIEKIKDMVGGLKE